MTAEVTGGAVGAAVLAAVRAGPASVADFYKDKRVGSIVGGPPAAGVPLRQGAAPPHLPPLPAQAAVPEIRRVTWLKKPEVHWEPHFSSRPSR